MTPLYHARSDSSDTSSTGSSYQHILDHVLTYNASYEMPLRSMYTLNCAPRAQPMPHRRGTPSSSTTSSSSSPTSPIMQHGWQEGSATQVFSENLMAQMSSLSSQPTSLPPSFITSFLGRCFPPELVCVDFPQALTGLDYLKDLETRRKREVACAINRLGYDRASLPPESELEQQFPGIARWLKGVEDKERRVESLYTRIYVGLRRWILINELSLMPFNKHNCAAMLNTLYPPLITVPPTSKLTLPILKAQRDGFFKYIQSVEANGPRVLTNLMQQDMEFGDDNGWASVVRYLGQYLQLSNSMINECLTVGYGDEPAPVKTHVYGRNRQGKADSGISLIGTDGRPSTSTAPSSPIEPSRPKTPSGTKGTALEKLARGLKTIGRSRTDVTEISPKEAMFERSPQKNKSLRKMRSMGNINEHNRSATASNTPAFDPVEMQRQRLRYEAGQPRAGTRQSHEV